jgi:hypothetical protein
MPEGVGYGPQNTASIGLELNVVGTHCYAASGSVIYNNNETTALEFETGAFVTRATVQVNTLDYDGDDLGILLYFNGVVISQQRFITVGASTFTDFPRWDLVIPPFTKFKLTFDNLTDTTGHTASAVFAGRLYK